MADAMLSDRRTAKIDAAKQALQLALAQLPDDAQVGVLALNTPGDDGNWIVPLGPIDRGQIRQLVDQLQAEGGTELGAAMKVAADALLERRKEQYYGEYRLLIVTDGEAQDADLVDRYLPQIRRRNLRVDVIGVSMAQDHSLATRVDGYRRADDRDALRQAIHESLAETVPAAQDSDEATDFELLAGLPTEVAVAAIQALSHADNRPIGLSDEADGDLAENRDGSQDSAPGTVPPTTERVAPGSYVVWAIVALCLVGVLKSLFRFRRVHR
jgi:uncharacterized protein YegL